MNNLAPLGVEMPVWAKDDEGFRVPYWVFQRGDVLEMENERLFRGETWNYMCLEAELQSPGDFVAVHVGETPVIVTRDHDGEIYAFDVTARVFKMLPASAPQPSTFPQKLSQTGCVDASDPTRLAPGVIPYTVSAELWADGADKERGFALPDGARIDVAADGDLTLPVGAVTMKTFRLGGKPVETRLFVRHDDGDWAGYSYEWDDAGRDATLLVTGKVKAVGAQTWTFPSRGECLQCHTAAAGRSLGLELPQLNRDYLYPATNRTDNQLRVLDHIGVLSAPLANRGTAIRDEGAEVGGAKQAGEPFEPVTVVAVVRGEIGERALLGHAEQEALAQKFRRKRQCPGILPSLEILAPKVQSHGDALALIDRTMRYPLELRAGRYPDDATERLLTGWLVGEA